MKRKLIQQGLGGMTVSLPIGWVRKFKLKAGEEISITDTEGRLIIEPFEPGKTKKEARIELTEENRKNIYPLLTHFYRRCFDRITITNLDPKSMDEIKRVKELMLGFEIVENSSKSCVLENISEPTEQKYDVLLRRCFLIVKESFDAAIAGISSNDYSGMAALENLRKEQDKYILFCRRILVKRDYSSSSMLEWELLTFLMHFQHTIYYLYDYFCKNKLKSDKDVISMVIKAKDYFGIYYDSYFKGSIEGVHRLNNLKEEYQFGKCLDLIEKSKEKNNVMHSYIRELFRLIQIGASPVLASIIDKSNAD